MQDEVSHPVFLTDSNRGVRISLIQIVVRRVESRRVRWRQEMHGGGEAAAFPKPYFFDVSLSFMLLSNLPTPFTWAISRDPHCFTTHYPISPRLPRAITFLDIILKHSAQCKSFISG